MTSTGDVLVHQRACSNNRGTTQTGLAPSKHSRHYPNDTGTEQTVVPAYQPVIPTKAGIHCHTASRDPKWIPAFAGMTSTRDVLVHQRACSNNRGTTQTGQIGRASCRERVKKTEVDGRGKKEIDGVSEKDA